MTFACTRCGVLGPVRHLGDAQVALCARCVLTPPCAPFAHAYRGAEPPGRWVCLRCGAVLVSEAITTAPVPVPQAPPMDFGC